MIARLHVDAFFVSVERAHDPSLAGRPVVIGGAAGGRGAVVAASVEARQHDVVPGISVTEAERRCPDGVFLPGAFDRYLQASEAIDELVRRWCPIVEWTAIDEAYLDPTARQRSPAHARIVAERIQADLRQRLALETSCGIGASKTVAHVAATLARPRGLLYVLPGYEAKFLAPLNLDVLPGVGPSLAARLRQAGVRTLGELARLDAAMLSQRLGPGGAVLAQQAAGIDDRRVQAERVPRAVSEEYAFETGTRDEERVRAALDTLVARAAYRLRMDGLFARTVTVKIRHGDSRLETRAATLREPSALDSVLGLKARQIFDALARPHRGVCLVGVSLSGLLPDGRQLSLFPVRGDSRDLTSAAS